MRPLGSATVLLLLAGWAAASTEKAPAVTFAVLRQDGILIPFATFDGRWKNPWPVPLRSPEVPAALADVPKAWWPFEAPQIDWIRWTSDGESVPLKVSAPVWFRAQCLANIGLRTDFRAPVPPAAPEATPYPKVGLATTTWGAGEPTIEPVVVLGEDSPDWRTLGDRIRESFDKAENQAIKNNHGWKHPYSNRDRERQPIVLEALYRVGDVRPGTFVYHFEAVRRYMDRNRRSSEQACDLITFAVGWVQHDPRGESSVWVSARITDCYRWNVSFSYPLGVVRLPSGRGLWVVQSSSWSAESYSVVDLVDAATPKVLINTPGGWCG